MRIMLLALPAVLFAQLCETEGIGMGSGMITVHNGDNDPHDFVVTDTPTSCTVGLKGSLNGDTTRTFDIDEKGAYFCVGGGGGVRVENGGSYIIRGGALSPQ